MAELGPRARKAERRHAQATETALSACQEKARDQSLVITALRESAAADAEMVKHAETALSACQEELARVDSSYAHSQGRERLLERRAEAAEAARDENHRAHVLVSAECKQIAADLVACQEEAEEKLTHLEGMWAYERDRAEAAETALSSEATKGET